MRTQTASNDTTWSKDSQDSMKSPSDRTCCSRRRHTKRERESKGTTALHQYLLKHQEDDLIAPFSLKVSNSRALRDRSLRGATLQEGGESECVNVYLCERV